MPHAPNDYPRGLCLQDKIKLDPIPKTNNFNETMSGQKKIISEKF